MGFQKRARTVAVDDVHDVLLRFHHQTILCHGKVHQFGKTARIFEVNRGSTNGLGREGSREGKGGDEGGDKWALARKCIHTR